MFPPGCAKLATSPAHNRIASNRNNRDGRGRVLGSLGCCQPPGNNDIKLQADHLGGKIWEPFQPPLSMMVFNPIVMFRPSMYPSSRIPATNASLMGEGS